MKRTKIDKILKYFKVFKTSTIIDKMFYFKEYQ